MSWMKELQHLTHSNAVSKGFYRDAERTNPEIAMRLMLIVSEVSEALEDLRCGKRETTLGFGGKPVGFGSELADVVIRVMDLAEWLGVDLEKEIEDKHSYNTTRQPMHGGKEF